MAAKRFWNAVLSKLEPAGLRQSFLSLNGIWLIGILQGFPYRTRWLNLASALIIAVLLWAAVWWRGGAVSRVLMRLLIAFHSLALISIFTVWLLPSRATLSFFLGWIITALETTFLVLVARFLNSRPACAAN